MTNLFPTGIAYSDAFCNRDEERKKLKHHFKHHYHTLLIAPRRYGKTSLVLKALDESKFPYAYIQLFNTYTDQAICDRFIEGFSQLLSQLYSPTQKTLQKISHLLSSAKLSLTVANIKFKFQIEPTVQSPKKIIVSLLNDLENILKTKKKTAILFLDEFQDVIQSDMSDELQSLLRDFAQRSQFTTLIISGSQRHMLCEIFDDKNKPFYKLMERLNIERIQPEAFKSFINQLAKKHWKKSLEDSVLDSIISLTESHPYYVNRLCRELWQLDKPPKINNIEQAWIHIQEQEFSSIANELSLLTKNQRLVLKSLSQHQHAQNINGHEFVKATGISAASINQSIKMLIKYDFVEKSKHGYFIIDPCLKAIMCQN